MFDKQKQLETKIFRLQAFCAAMTLLVGCVLVMGFASQNKQKFAEIDVERINIVEKDGKLRMVISNEARQHPGIVNGKIIKRDGPRPPGMIFFNHLGDEMGGLIFGGSGNEHFGSLTWDKVRNDQTIGFRHLESGNGTYTTGLQMWQQPNVPGDVMVEKMQAARKISDPVARNAAIQKLVDGGEWTTNRLFLGKYRDNTTLLEMSDIKGKPRIRLQVAPNGAPRLEFLDENGKVIESFPRDANGKK